MILEDEEYDILTTPFRLMEKLRSAPDSPALNFPRARSATSALSPVTPSDFSFQFSGFQLLPRIPCRSMESAIKLAERFIAGATKPARPASEPSTLNPQPSTESVTAQLTFPGARAGDCFCSRSPSHISRAPLTFRFQLVPPRRTITRLFLMGGVIAQSPVGQPVSPPGPCHHHPHHPARIPP